jgi:hypothetical protein
MTTKQTHPYRLSAIAIILGGLLSLPIEYLFLLTHGPYEQALNRIVWGLDHHDYSRWAVFSALLILPGLLAFHRWQQDAYARLGLWGFRLSFGGFALATLGQIWDYVLFDPWEHPMHGIGFLMQLIAILMILIGIPLWATAIFRGKTLIGWQITIPILWLLYSLGLLLSIFTLDENWLFPRLGIDGGFIADFLLSLAFVLMSIILWSVHED